MDLATFIDQRRSEWRRLEAVLQRVEGSGLRSLDDDQAVEFGQLYRRAASDLNQAQTLVSGDATVQYLNDLVGRCYLVIYSRSKIDLGAVFRHLIWGFPAVFRQHLGPMLLATALFAAGTVFGALASHLDPASREYLLPQDMPTIQPPEEGEEDTASVMTTDELAGFSSFLFTHNVSVSLFAFALGMTVGLGTAWLMFYNGVSLGALGVVFFEAHQFMAFATGVLPHGVLEIPAALIGGAAGFVLAQAILAARPWSRLDELRRAGGQALLLVAGCFPLLAVAALLEAGVARAPDWFLQSGLKLAVAGVFGLLFVVYVFLLGWGDRATALSGRLRRPTAA
jgi:uncharacterized membrane protein SpoIIM required for sporulation